MNDNENHLPEQQFDSWLIAYHEALAAGSTPTPTPDLRLGPDVVPRMQRAQACLHLLERVWPRCSQGTAEDHAENPAAASPTVHDLPVRINRFQIRRELGRGGFGIVFLAWDPKLGREVALKVPRGDALIDGELRRRFIWEAQTAAGLSHPHIVHVLEAGLAGVVLYIASEYCPGTTLADWLARRQQPVTARSAATLVAMLAETVHYIHSQGILHRDLKPRNILLTLPPKDTVKNPDRPASELEDFIPKVTDFGLAKVLERGGDETMTGTAIGTVRYMAPEQVRGRSKEIGWYADVYALGVILYELVTGRPPFRADGKQDTREQILSPEPPLPLHRFARVPRDLRTICLKCLEKEPKKRYSSAQALADDVNRFLNGEPIQARPVSPVGKTWRWCRRNPAVAALIVAITFLLLAGTGISSYFAFEAVGRLYISNMRLARQAWDEGQMEWLQELLHSQLPKQTLGKDLRGFEWHYWQRLCHADLLTLAGHTERFSAIAFSPDGKWLASGSEDSTVRIWDAGNGKEITTLKGHGKNAVVSVAFSPDARSLVSAGYDGTLKVWDVASGEEKRTINDDSGCIKCIAFSSDGRRLASGGALEHAVRDLSASVLGRLGSPLGEGPLLVAFEIVARRTMGKVRIWDLSNGQEVSTLKGHTEEVSGVTFSPDGRLLASGSEDGTARIWDAASGQEVLHPLRGQVKWICSVAFSPCGKLLATAGNAREHKGEVIIWEVGTGQKRHTLLGHTRGVSTVAFSPDGQRLASGSQDQTVRIWDVASGQELLNLRSHIGYIRCVAFSPDSQRLASAGEDGKVKVWDAVNTKEAVIIARPSKHVYGVAFSPDGKRLAWGGEMPGQPGGELGIWDADQGKGTLRLLEGHTKCVNGVAFSPSGEYLASASDDKTVRLWDVASGKELRCFPGHTREVWSVAFSPDGRRLASATMDRTIRVWDRTTGQEGLVLNTDTQWVTTVAFSPDGTRIASADDKEVKVWNAISGEAIHTLRGHPKTIWSVAFSPDGKLLASAANDGTVRIWHMITGQQRAVLKGHTNNVSGVVFSPDGRRLASSSLDHTVKLWDVASGQETLTLKGHKAWVFSVAFSRDGHRLASGSHDGTVRIWDATPLPQ